MPLGLGGIEPAGKTIRIRTTSRRFIGLRARKYYVKMRVEVGVSSLLRKTELINKSMDYRKADTIENKITKKLIVQIIEGIIDQGRHFLRN